MTSSEQLVVENRQFATFDRLDEFESLLKSILSVNVAEDPTEEEEESEMNSTRKITLILDTFQEQSYLLDPFLERLVVPTMEAFKQHVMAFVRDPSRPGSSSRAVRLATILYWFSKNRGAKTVVRFFPHQIEDLTAVLTYLSTPTSYANKDENWQIRYCLLLWLSLVIMIPFDLSRFDPDDATKTGETFKALEEVGKNNLDRAGIDGEGAATLLAKLYSRRDASRGLEGFLNWADTRLTDKADPFMAIGVLHVLCDMTKTGGSLRAADLDHIQSLNNNLESKGRLSANTLVRKWRAKLTSRLALCSLPQKTATIARKQLMGNILSVPSQDDADLDAEIPDTIESTIETLLSALQDRDTTVRWSAAKGLARITERLPKDFCDQILESVMELFSIHLNDVSGVLADLQPVAEPTWHGASLACAEIARRGLVSESNLPILVGWLQKGLYFDVRKGAHSIGSNVRDATAYVLWAMARAHDIDSLRPFALDLARQLVAVAVFDREVHIRRAASAAFQENVGRTGLYPHGIDVVRKADFFTVGIRRNAFLVAAPQVAEHVEYRSLLTNHLLTITLKHWDPSMRQLGSTALAEIAKLNISEDGPTCAFRAATLLSSPDSDEVHGGLLALSELAKIYKESQILEAKRLEIFQYIISLPQSTFTRYRNELIVEAGCMAISNSISIEALHLPESDIKTPWRSIVDMGLKHRLPEVQYAAAHAMGVVSRLTDCTADVKK
ncbi:hypothetical protein FRC02_003235 [Tulasnella sp. 418]|nr:hypothetical protein FRC02_003235 [Tulasnella sp. 418]